MYQQQQQQAGAPIYEKRGGRTQKGEGKVHWPDAATHTRVMLTTGQEDICEEVAARPTIKVTSRQTGAGASGNSVKGGGGSR